MTSKVKGEYVEESNDAKPAKRMKLDASDVNKNLLDSRYESLVFEPIPIPKKNSTKKD